MLIAAILRRRSPTGTKLSTMGVRFCIACFNMLTIFVDATTPQACLPVGCGRGTAAATLHHCRGSHPIFMRLFEPVATIFETLIGFVLVPSHPTVRVHCCVVAFPPGILCRRVADGQRQNGDNSANGRRISQLMHGHSHHVGVEIGDDPA
jgi:hypothetical protein